ncbi:MAG: hypothetical protein EOP45_23405, partial [Sphingobacteriaceae bacterium]
MNTIHIVQNELKQLRKLLVEDNCYSAAKAWNLVQVALVVFVSAGLALTATICERWSVRAAIYGLAVSLLDFYLLEPQIAKLKVRAASVRECFDLDVLSLTPSPFRSADITPEDVRAIPNPMPDARKKNKIDWYPVVVKDISVEPARLICQRSSMQYDERLRKSFSYLWIGLVVVFVAAWLGWLAKSNPDFYHIALVTSAILPAFLFCVKQNQLNNEACAKISVMRAFFDAIWKELLANNTPPYKLTEDSRQIQSELFDHRSQRPLVPNFYYRLKRNQNERIMNEVAEDYVEEYKLA